jgi:hypothetical protein
MKVAVNNIFIIFMHDIFVRVRGDTQSLQTFWYPWADGTSFGKLDLFVFARHYLKMVLHFSFCAEAFPVLLITSETGPSTFLSKLISGKILCQTMAL